MSKKENALQAVPSSRSLCMIYKKVLPKFVKLLDQKMLKGFYSYGDKSFSRDPKELMNEIQAEIIDIAGWGMVLWQRIEDLKKKWRKK